MNERQPDDEEERSFTIRLPESLHAKLKAKAKQEDRSMTATVRHALKQYTDGIPA